jgi:peptidoglycan-N-acetylglucosamine deacetylase
VSPIVSCVAIEQPLVALTFDDGPAAKYTPLLLDVLDSESAPATFFILGSALDLETRQIVERMHADGHEVANHTHSHLNFEGASDSTIHDEIARTHRELEEITGRPPTLLRPPYGRAPEAVNAVAERDGYRATVLWSAWAYDWENPQATADVMVDRVRNGYLGCGGARPGGIVLMHDGCAPEQVGTITIADSRSGPHAGACPAGSRLHLRQSVGAARRSTHRFVTTCINAAPRGPGRPSRGS